MIKLYWYLSAYIRKHGLKFLAVVIGGWALFSLVIPLLMQHFSHGQTRYLGVVGEYTLDNLPDVIAQQLSRSLVTIDTDGSFVGDLGECFLSTDGLRYRCVLEEDLVWSDGRPLQASDLHYRVSGARVTFDNAKREIIYELPEVFASFPQLLTTPLLRLETVKKFGLWRRVEVYGLRAARLTSYEYRAASRHALKQVIVDDPVARQRFVYRFYYTQQQAVDGFKLGEVDYLFDVAAVGEVKDWPNTQVEERDLADQYLAVFFNNNDPLLTRNVRQALSYAVEKDRPGYERSPGPISKNSWAYFNGIKTYDKNIASGVERLLDELPAAPLELTLVTTADYFDVASRIKEDWDELSEAAVTACQESEDIEAAAKTACAYLHIDTHIQIQQLPDTNNFQVLLIGQKVALDPDQYSLWHSGLATNFTHYKNTKVDNFLERGRQTVVASERLANYQEFQQALLEDPPAIFLWYLKTADLRRDASRVGLELEVELPVGDAS
ncbi:hypothetical protein IJJ12_02950 [bacterium]|nr:hypothetical protein [bacterium]